MDPIQQLRSQGKEVGVKTSVPFQDYCNVPLSLVLTQSSLQGSLTRKLQMQYQNANGDESSEHECSCSSKNKESQALNLLEAKHSEDSLQNGTGQVVLGPGKYYVTAESVMVIQVADPNGVQYSLPKNSSIISADTGNITTI